MLIRYHGHSCIQIMTGESSIILDPFLTGNPVAVTRPEQIQAHYVLLTHGHTDHITDAVAIAKQNNAPIIAAEELALHMGKQGVDVEIMNIGGEWNFDFGKVYVTPALHSSSVTDTSGESLSMGVSVGFLLTIEDYTIYYAGDTGLFGDMKWLGERQPIDLAFLPIGDRFTMGPSDAITAAQWLQAKCVVPIHFNTFPAIRQDGRDFTNRLAAQGIQGRVMEPGQTLTIKQILAQRG
ncbi:metal-dependent hydrolase [Cohnella mopanensis]|uniref:metal-dependent hydrolase n=1 Tax=Cohnella mopanensis TaxID=2911966 RepID=UPI001EF87E7E|nr:metal-dependent hydrolase [Cohnella mopanensis]